MEIYQAAATVAEHPASPSPTPSHEAYADDHPSSSSVFAEGQEGSDSEVDDSSSSSSSVGNYDDDEDEDEDEGDVCRICRNPGDADDPLSYPCACSGSIKFVHQDCLLRWLNHSNTRQCEVCKHAFAFSPVYADNAPARLPFHEFVVGMGIKACHVVQFFLCLSFVLSVWLLIVPFVTFWIWRLAFVRSFIEAQRLFLSHLSTTTFLTDCLRGFLLFASIVFIFVGVISLRDYLWHLREVGGQDAERNDDGERNGERAAARGLTGLPNRNEVAEVNVDDDNGAHGIAGAGQPIRRNAENVAAHWDMLVARLAAHVEQIFDGLDDADGAEDIPFDELVGMQGPIFHVVENAVKVLASNMIFLGVIIFIPFTLGRITLHYVTWLFGNGPVLSKVVHFTVSALSLANITLKNALTDVASLSSFDQNGVVGSVAEKLGSNVSTMNETLNNISNRLQGDLLTASPIGSSKLSDVTALAIGYLVIFSAILCYLGIVTLIRYTKGELQTNGRFYGIASIAKAVQSLFRHFLAAMGHLVTMIKVAFLLVFEFGAFPLMCGWWLDICTIRIFGKSMAHRVQFFSVSPVASCLVHWVIGIVYMLQLSIFLRLLRGILRNDVLYFLQDPADPNYNPFRDLIDDPVHKHAHRVLLSVVAYGSLIVMLVFLPVKLAMRIAPSIFPLDIFVIDPFTEIPADMLLFQICIPFAIEHFKLRTTFKSLLRYWLTAVGWALGLTEFLLPRPEDIGAPEIVNEEPARQDRLQIVQQGGQDRAMVVGAAINETNVGAVVSDSAVVEYDDEQSDSEYSFVLRIMLLLMAGWVTLLIFRSALIVIPVSLGRKLFTAIPLLPITHGIKFNDLYAFIFGSYVIWTGISGARYTVDHAKSRRAVIFLAQICKCCDIIFKSSALLSLWIFVIPVLIGLLFELLVIVPMRVPADESPVFLLYQDWALGIIFLKIWTRLVMLDHMLPFVDDSWRLKFERVREDGFSRLQGLWVLREIVLPIMTKLLTALCVPYVLAKGVFPALGYPLIVNSAVYRFAWLGCLSLGVLCFCAKRVHVWFANLHNTIRDDRYLIGRRLHNFGEGSISKRPADAE